MQERTPSPLPKEESFISPREEKKILSESSLAAALHAASSSIGLVILGFGVYYFKIIPESLSPILTPVVPPVATIIAYFIFNRYKKRTIDKEVLSVFIYINKKYEIIFRSIDIKLQKTKKELRKAKTEIEKGPLLSQIGLLNQEKANMIKAEVDELTSIKFHTESSGQNNEEK